VWCALGIVVLAASDAVVYARLGGENEEVRIVIEGGALTTQDLCVHFAMPAHQAWDNVVHWCATVLPFARAADVAAWCLRHALPQGDIVPLTRVLALARDWYGAHLEPDWRKWTRAEAQAIFDRTGLHGEIWRLPETTGTF
jgi:hypothetical protein